MFEVAPSTLKRAGIIATGAALLGAIADLLLFFTPGFSSNPLRVLPNIGFERALAGTYLGVLIIPLMIAGYWMVAQRVQPAGPFFSRTLLLLGTYGVVLGTAIHAFVGIVLQSIFTSGLGPDNISAYALQFAPFITPAYVIFYLMMTVGSVIFIIAVRRSPDLPNWLVWIAPIVPNIIVPIFGWLLPALGDFAWPSTANLSHVLFFGVLTVLFWDTD